MALILPRLGEFESHMCSYVGLTPSFFLQERVETFFFLRTVDPSGSPRVSSAIGETHQALIVVVDG